MSSGIFYKQAALNMKYLVGEDLQEIITHRSQNIKQKIDYYVDTFLPAIDPVQKESEFTAYKKVFCSVFLQYVSEFVRGELDDETNVIFHFDDAISPYIQRNHLDDILASTNANESTADPIWHKVMKEYTQMVEEIAHHSVYRDNRISFSYATYAALANLRNIFIYLNDPKEKIASCFSKSELFIDTISSECKKNREHLQSLQSELFDDEVGVLDEIEDVEEL